MFLNIKHVLLAIEKNSQVTAILENRSYKQVKRHKRKKELVSQALTRKGGQNSSDRIPIMGVSKFGTVFA